MRAGTAGAAAAVAVCRMLLGYLVCGAGGDETTLLPAVLRTVMMATQMMVVMMALVMAQ